MSRKEKLKNILGILAGHASMCWNPKPSNQVFDSIEAGKTVDKALQEIEGLDLSIGEIHGIIVRYYDIPDDMRQPSEALAHLIIKAREKKGE